MTTQIIAVDQGNTHTRVACYNASDLDRLAPGVLPVPTKKITLKTGELDDPSLSRPYGMSEDPRTPWMVASVHRAGLERLREWHKVQFPESPWRELAATDFGLLLAVRRPERVGVDRVAAASAARWLHGPGRPLIVIDVGTAITVDAVDGAGVFLGGTILAGPTLNLRALGRMTSQLPAVELPDGGDPPPVIGTDTESALISGAYWGCVGAVRELVRRVESQFDQSPHVVVTGGLGRIMARALDLPRSFEPELVLSGIALASTVPG